MLVPTLARCVDTDKQSIFPSSAALVNEIYAGTVFFLHESSLEKNVTSRLEVRTHTHTHTNTALTVTYDVQETEDRRNHDRTCRDKRAGGEKLRTKRTVSLFAKDDHWLPTTNSSRTK